MTDIGFEGFDPRRQALPMVRNEAVMFVPSSSTSRRASDLLDLRKIWSAVWRHRPAGHGDRCRDGRAWRPRAIPRPPDLSAASAAWRSRTRR